MEKTKDYKRNAWYLALINLPYTLKIILVVSIIIVLINQIQQFFEYIQFSLFDISIKYYAIIKVFSEFISKLAYAVITSSIFYYITQQFPKEKKRIRVAELLHNAIPFIKMPFTDFEFDLLKIESLNLTEKQYNEKCKNVLLDSPVRDNLKNCINWDKFTIQTMEKITIKIDEINQLNDLLDSDTFIILQKIKSNCLTILNILALRGRANNDSNSKNMEYISSLLYTLRNDFISLENFGNKFIKTYINFESKK
ncbi:hypothetical protein PQ459_12315 [Chryseobacterium sp. KACC 21268]|nr:hypothetical protein PQ459_12315 [Chryseobacterium sp. KACC 21268]